MDGNSFLILIIILLVTGFLITIYIVLKKLNKLQIPDQNSSVLIQNQINNVVQSMDMRLSETNRIIQEQMQASNQRLQFQNTSNNDLLNKISHNNNKILTELTEKMVKVEDTNKQIMGFAEQMQSLENILKSPKQRGILGEYFLKLMLQNVLPTNSFKTQYGFSDGTIVDAVIFSKDKIIPIDAKFSLETCNKIFACTDPLKKLILERELLNDVKKRIEETSKYVKPEEGTIDIAFMFVPADGVFHEIMRVCGEGNHSFDLISYAYAKKVILVSPTSFFAYLQTVLQALNSFQIEKEVEDIIKYLNESTKYLKQFEENMTKLGKQLQTTTNVFNSTNTSARMMSKRISRITNNESAIINVEKIEGTSE